MKDISIKRDSQLFKLVAFLQKLPIFSLFIKKDWEIGYTTFNDICTFCRHLLYSFFTIVFYILFFCFIFYVLIITPLISLFSGFQNIQGNIILISIFAIFASYFIILLIQHFVTGVSYIIDKRNEKKVKEISDVNEEKPSLIKDLFKIISQKHDNFCKRLKIEE